MLEMQPCSSGKPGGPSRSRKAWVCQLQRQNLEGAAWSCSPLVRETHPPLIMREERMRAIKRQGIAFLFNASASSDSARPLLLLVPKELGAVRQILNSIWVLTLPVAELPSSG